MRQGFSRMIRSVAVEAQGTGAMGMSQRPFMRPVRSPS
jgi:hypothetical protein